MFGRFAQAQPKRERPFSQFKPFSILSAVRFAVSALSLCMTTCLPQVVFAQESYADVQITTPPHWSMREMQTFSGTVPSRAWVYGKDDEEVAVSVLVTEGIVNGLAGQSITILAKLYTEAFATGWGAKVKGAPDGTKATYCGGEAGYRLEAAFGEKKFDYYGCLIMQKDKLRIATVVTWVLQGTPEQIPARRLMTFIEAVKLNNETGGEEF